VKNVILHFVISYSINLNVMLDNCPIVTVDPYNPPLSIVYSFKKTCNLKFDNFVLNWNSGDYFSITSYLGSINWSTLFCSNTNINENLDTFYYHIDYAIQNYIPKSRRHKLCFPIWFSNELKILFKEKKSHSTFKILKTTVSYTYISDIRKKCNYLRYRDYQVFINKTQQTVKLNSKSFWNFYRLQKFINQLPSSVSYKEKEANTGSDIVNLFREHFSNVYKTSTLNNSENFIFDNSSFNLNSINISKMDVFNELLVY